MARLNDGKAKEKHSKLIEVEKCRTIFSTCKSIQRHYLVGGLEHLLFSPIVGMMIQSDYIIFFRGVGIPPTSYDSCLIVFVGSSRPPTFQLLV